MKNFQFVAVMAMIGHMLFGFFSAVSLPGMINDPDIYLVQMPLELRVVVWFAELGMVAWFLGKEV